jgi:hypothetical protein
MYVYFVRSFEPNMVKVGRSKNPRGRVDDMQVGSASRLSLLGTFECHSRFACIRLERTIHAALAPYWAHGEWHSWTPAVEEYVMSILNGQAIPIEDAAAKHGVDVRRLRGAVWTNGLLDPIGDVSQDLVQEDDTLGRWVEKQKERQP